MTLNYAVAYKAVRCCQLISTAGFIPNSNNLAITKEFPDYIRSYKVVLRNFDVIVFVFNTYSMLVFSSSNDIGDWHTNVRFLPTNGFHGGYYEAIQELLPLLQKTVDNRPFYLTGHSMGGGLASIYSVQQISNSNWLGTYIFGSPKVLAPSYKCLVDSKVAAKVHAFRHEQDIVSYMPMLYKHIGSPWFIDRNFRISSTTTKTIHSLMFVRAVQLYKNHELSTYATAIKKAQQVRS